MDRFFTGITGALIACLIDYTAWTAVGGLVFAAVGMSVNYLQHKLALNTTKLGADEEEYCSLLQTLDLGYRN